MIESQVRYVLDALRTIREQSLATVDVKLTCSHTSTTASRSSWPNRVGVGLPELVSRRQRQEPNLVARFTFKFREACGEFKTDDYELEAVA